MDLFRYIKPKFYELNIIIAFNYFQPNNIKRNAQIIMLITRDRSKR